MEINFNNFLPSKENSSNAIVSANDIPVIENILEQSETFKAIVNNRIQGLKVIESLWAKGKKREAIQSTQLCKDLGVINDLIFFFVIKSDLQNLNIKIDQAIDLFPFIIKLASSKYDAHIQNAVNSSWVLIKLFSNAIKRSPATSKKDEEMIKQYNTLIRLFRELRLVPNINNIIAGGKKIEGLVGDKYANDIEEFIKK